MYQNIAHDEFHDDLLSEVKVLLKKYRDKFLIPPRWRIDIGILCPEDMAKRNPVVDGVMASMSWEFLANAHYRLRVCCNLDRENLEWVVMHELLEAITAPYADFTRNLIDRTPGSVRNKVTLDSRHMDVRDEIIEWILDILAPDKRPDVRQNI